VNGTYICINTERRPIQQEEAFDSQTKKIVLLLWAQALEIYYSIQKRNLGGGINLWPIDTLVYFKQKPI